MPAKVVDASALAAVLLVEPAAEALHARLRGFDLAAPTLVIFEFGNVCWKRAQREPDKLPFYEKAVKEFNLLEMAQYPVDAHAVWRLAMGSRLTFYDASYLWLARELNADLVTLDSALEEVYRAIAMN